MIESIFGGITHIMYEIFIALLPIVVMYLILQIFSLKMHRKEALKIGIGFIVTYIGLVLFMQGVHVAFLPVGTYIGETLGEGNMNWVLIPLGFIIGFLVAFAEPAVRVMIKQVEELTSGAIKHKVLLFAVSIGVAIAVSIAMIRIIYNISIWYILVPGYIIAFILTRFADDTFIAIAFDNGGVATGPMCSTFILSLCVGVANVSEGNSMINGFGAISLIALAPILTTMILGFVYQKRDVAQEDKMSDNDDKDSDTVESKLISGES